jgi:hypothetical protein
LRRDCGSSRRETLLHIPPSRNRLAVRHRDVDQLRELRRDALRQRGRVDAPARYAVRHESGIRLSGRGMRLLEMVDLRDMLGRMGELEGYSLAMPAGRKAATSDNRDLMAAPGLLRSVEKRFLLLSGRPCRSLR